MPPSHPTHFLLRYETMRESFHEEKDLHCMETAMVQISMYTWTVSSQTLLFAHMMEGKTKDRISGMLRLIWAFNVHVTQQLISHGVVHTCYVGEVKTLTRLHRWTRWSVSELSVYGIMKIYSQYGTLTEHLQGKDTTWHRQLTLSYLP